MVFCRLLLSSRWWLPGRPRCWRPPFPLPNGFFASAAVSNAASCRFPLSPLPSGESDGEICRRSIPDPVARAIKSGWCPPFFPSRRGPIPPFPFCKSVSFFFSAGARVTAVTRPDPPFLLWARVRALRFFFFSPRSCRDPPLFFYVLVVERRRHASTRSPPVFLPLSPSSPNERSVFSGQRSEDRRAFRGYGEIEADSAPI